MIQAALSALVLLGAFRFLKNETDYEISWWLAFVAVLVPAILLSWGSLGLQAAGLDPGYVLLGYPLYFLFPFLLLKLGLDFPAVSAAKHAGVVLLVVFLVEVGLALAFGRE